MSMSDSSWLEVSRATLTIINMLVAPKLERAVMLYSLSMIAGIVAMSMRNRAPKRVSLLEIFVRYVQVGLPGRIPGINPPFSCMFFAISYGLNVIVV